MNNIFNEMVKKYENVKYLVCKFMQCLNNV